MTTVDAGTDNSADRLTATGQTEGFSYSSAGPRQESQLIELLEALYNSTNPTRRWLHCTRRDWLIAKIANLARERPGRALEVGFGAGVYLKALATNYREVVATDIEETHREHAANLAEKHPNLRVLVDDITHSQLSAETFDLVLCSEVIEHIADPIHAISGLRRVLAPGGYLLVSTPQRYSVMECACKVAFKPGVINLVKWVYGEPVFETGHISLMTEREMTYALESAGFRILERFKSGLYLPLIAEFAGTAGLGLERWLEDRLRNSRFNWTLWTQYYVAQR
jgi:2-polyprenyl-3-methyl-5-hydroxy-6-metoxy-1,4-benzoquinol methylase